jgi:hypothetical protein
MTQLAQFLFILVLPIVIAAGAVVTLFAVGAIFDALDNPGDLRRRVEGLFHARSRPPRIAGPGHYYKPYWAGR